MTDTILTGARILTKAPEDDRAGLRTDRAMPPATATPARSSRVTGRPPYPDLDCTPANPARPVRARLRGAAQTTAVSRTVARQASAAITPAVARQSASPPA